MVISSKFHMAQYRDDDRREDALQFTENGNEQANGNMKMGILKCFKKHRTIIISVTVIGLTIIIATVIVLTTFNNSLNLKVVQLKKKCESEGCNNGCLIVPERTWCFEGNNTDCYHKLCINKNSYINLEAL